MILLVLTTARQSAKTIEHAINHAKANQVPLHALFVVDEAVTKQAIADVEEHSFMDNAAGQKIAKLLADEYIERGDTMLKALMESATEQHVEVTVDLKVGSLFEEIQACIQREESSSSPVQRIVITRRERSKFSRILFGSPLAELASDVDVQVDIVED